MNELNQNTLDKGVVFVDGVFDLLHVGHVRFLRKARQFGGFLLVGVHSDLTVRKYKRQPVYCEAHRYELVEALHLVDMVVRDAPLFVSLEFILKWRVSVVAHGDDNAFPDFYRVPIQMGIMRYVPYTKDISSSDIIKSICVACPKKDLGQ